ncbi:hypothetical protein HDU83_006925 [Entophlyctis luteolus]|nr:hypothetical protein HDU83_006925 [Entophlyctis luteolus]
MLASDVASDITLVSVAGDFSVVVRPLGATIVSILYADRSGAVRDLVHGFQTASEQENAPVHQYFGTIGRVAHRIENAEFKLNNKVYKLAVTKPPHAAHGGVVGFDSKIWDVLTRTTSSVTLQLLSSEGEEGFPLPLVAKITYTIEGTALCIDYEAFIPENVSSVDETETIVNLTSHTFFNLTGMTNPSILSHEAYFPNSKGHLPLKPNQIPSSDIESTPAMDFTTKPKTFEADFAQVLQFKGYDHFYVIKDFENANDNLQLAAVVRSPDSGIEMSMSTTAVGFQLYTGNYLNGTVSTKAATQPEGHYTAQSAFCLEASAPPNAINSEDPNVRAMVVVKCGGKPWRQRTVYQFTVRQA